ncbi:hypothetical protein SteCoe_33679 [Stentor coeruleus]|uniref:Uncharacterized protein n=1 Tax=Stentor coeruleus TaxID=5963 RepID=A0A1R2AW78_9CILI|nr:hypothetical protein SteCoe_33679 [Stentor coeruleus]
MDPSDGKVSDIDEFLSLDDNEESKSLKGDNVNISIDGQSDRNTFDTTTEMPQNKPRGRKKIRITKVLEEFCCQDSDKIPKKEYVITSMIRGLKKGFRNISSGITPSNSCIVAIDNKSEEEGKILNYLKKIYLQNPEMIEKMASTKNVSIVDGAKNTKSKAKGNKCYTNSCCQEFFSNSYMQDAFFKLIQLIYTGFNCDRCCSRFRFRCCAQGKNSFHTDGCKIKWKNLYKYFKKHFLNDLNIKRLPSAIFEDSEINS